MLKDPQKLEETPINEDTQKIEQVEAQIENKVEELFSQKWINDTWENFVECLKSYSNYGK